MKNSNCELRFSLIKFNLPTCMPSKKEKEIMKTLFRKCVLEKMAIKDCIMDLISTHFLE